MRNGYQPETKQQEDAYLKNSNSIDPKQVKCGTTKFLQYGLGDFYEKMIINPKQNNKKMHFLKNSNNIDPKKSQMQCR